MKNLKELIEAIIFVRKEGNKRLAVKTFGNFAYWNADEDLGWIEYRKARNFICRYKFVNKVLVFFKII